MPLIPDELYYLNDNVVASTSLLPPTKNITLTKGKTLTVVDVMKKHFTVSSNGQKCYVKSDYESCFVLARTMTPFLEITSAVQDYGGQQARKAKPFATGPAGQMKRPDFVPVPTPDTRAFDYKPNSKTTGNERVAQIEKRIDSNLMYDFETISPMTGDRVQTSGTYCSYCHEWFQTYTLDSDHVITSKEIGEWFQNIESLLNKNEHAYKKKIQDSLAGNFDGARFDSLFFKASDGVWHGSAQGALLFFNNVSNLVLTCKTCNQLLKNDKKGREHLSQSFIFGPKFDEQNPMGIENSVSLQDGTGLGDAVEKFNQLKRNRRSIDAHLNIFISNTKRTNRAREMLHADVVGNKTVAKGKRKKEEHLTQLFSIADDRYPSDEDDDSLDDLLIKNYQTTLELSQNNKTADIDQLRLRAIKRQARIRQLETAKAELEKKLSVLNDKYQTLRERCKDLERTKYEKQQKKIKP
ncbi:hypothetical protein [Corallococcus exercitus]|uniref:hypothetical protein n=1 Tax=Corallococcus exercitus TaxID=2316736 RepID=UPI0035D4D9CC